MPIATSNESRRLCGAGAGRPVAAGSGLSGLLLANIFATLETSAYRTDWIVDQNPREDIPAGCWGGRCCLMAGNGFRRGIYPHKLRDVPSRDESFAKRRERLRKMMMQHYVSIVVTDETVTTQNFSLSELE